MEKHELEQALALIQHKIVAQGRIVDARLLQKEKELIKLINEVK